MMGYHDKPESPPKPPQCEFCGTADRAHNVKPRGHHVFCDNPVCNALPGTRGQS